MKKMVFKFLVISCFLILLFAAFISSFFLFKLVSISGMAVGEYNSFKITASATESFQDYQWQLINTTSAEKRTVMDVDKSGRMIRLESNGDITLLRGYVKTLQGVFSLGSCAECRILEKKLLAEYYMTELDFETIKSSAIINIFIGDEMITKTASRKKTFDGRFMLEGNKQSIGRVSDYVFQDKIIEMNGTLSNLKYTLDTGALVKIYFSDTLTLETGNSSAEIIVERV